MIELLVPIFMVLGPIALVGAGWCWDDDPDNKIRIVACALAGVVMIGIAVRSVNDYEKSQPKCAIGHYETRHGMIMAGTVAVPTTYEDYVCDVYESKTP
jgi:hypothetical protein